MVTGVEKIMGVLMMIAGIYVKVIYIIEKKIDISIRKFRHTFK